MSKEIQNEVFDIVANVLISLGWSILEKPEENDSAFYDLIAISKYKAIRIEIKKVRELQSGSWQVPPVSKSQNKADIIAIILPNNYVFFEQMEDYLRKCSEKGYTALTWLKP